MLNRSMTVRSIVRLSCCDEARWRKA